MRICIVVEAQVHRGRCGPSLPSARTILYSLMNRMQTTCAECQCGHRPAADVHPGTQECAATYIALAHEDSHMPLPTKPVHARVPFPSALGNTVALLVNLVILSSVCSLLSAHEPWRTHVLAAHCLAFSASCAPCRSGLVATRMPRGWHCVVHEVSMADRDEGCREGRGASATVRIQEVMNEHYQPFACTGRARSYRGREWVLPVRLADFSWSL